jgi:VWFA-related protein
MKPDPTYLMSIAVTPANTTQITPGAMTMVATGTYAAGNTSNLSTTATWTSSNSTIAPAYAGGLVDFPSAANGTVTITDTSGSVSGSTSVTLQASGGDGGGSGGGGGGCPGDAPPGPLGSMQQNRGGGSLYCPPGECGGCSPNPDSKFVAHSELVLIPTIVTDRSGNHIGRLKQEDFAVLENGSARKIATFEEIVSVPHLISRPATPNEFSNSLTGGPSVGRITIIVLDFINTPFLDQTNTRKELLSYLSQSLDPREPTGLYTLTRTGLHVIHDFTTDPSVLVAALKLVRGDANPHVDSPENVEAPEALTGSASPGGNSGSGSGGGASGAGAQGAKGSAQKEAHSLQSTMLNSELNFQSFEQRMAITWTLDALQQIAQTLAGVPGRKSLLWAGGGFPFNVSNTMQLAAVGRDTLSDVLPLYERTWQLLNNAQVSLYPLDVKGLQLVTLPGASVSNPAQHFSRNMHWKNLDVQSSFEIFASMTGGRAYYNSNDLAKGFRDSVNDSAEYYMLGYYLDQSNPKPGWRKLAVKVRRDHAQVRARSGFFVTDVARDSDRTRVTDISSALQSPLDYTSLPLAARWDTTEPSKVPGKKHVTYSMRLAPDAAVIDESDGNHVVLDFVALAKTPEGKLADPPKGQKIDIRFTPEKLAAIRRHGITYNDTLDLPAGNYTVRFVVRDDLTGRVGSVAAPLKVE